MSPWFERQQVSAPAAEDTVHYVSAATVINASRKQVWDFIKPPENSVFLQPDVVRGFRAPGPEGTGEIQVFISARDGVEHVTALEVVQEIPYELAITRTLGGEDLAARGRDFLQDGADGTTILEHGRYFSLPAEAAVLFDRYEQHYKLFCRQYVERVKAFIEQSQMAAREVTGGEPPVAP